MKSLLYFFIFWAALTQARGQGYTFDFAGRTYMIPDLKKLTYAPEDTVMAGKLVFIKKERLDRFIPEGWKIPDLQDVKDFIGQLEGKDNGTGGKETDPAGLSMILPYRLNGIYFSATKKLYGRNTMTAYYIMPDVMHSFSEEKKEMAQATLHIYSGRNGKMNVEPSYTKADNAVYCNLLLIKK